VAELDLQEQVRRDDVYNRLVSINEQVSNLGVFPPLAWVWGFDILKDIYDNSQFEDATEVDYDVIAKGVTLKQIFDKFWQDVDSLGISLDLGGEIMEEVIRDWMYDNDFLIIVSDEEEDD
jgi:hypothetical protein